MASPDLEHHLDWIRSQFPALQQKVNGRPVIYLDGPGGTQVPQRVIDAVSDYLARSNANTHGGFVTSRRTDEVIATARQAMADFLGCEADEIVFGSNMTTMTFALSRALGRELHAGDEIVLTRLDHDANIAPWSALEERGVVIRLVDIDPKDCTLDMADLRGQVNERTRLVAVCYASNAVGTINDVTEITRIAHAVGSLVFVDAVHFAPHAPIDVGVLDCDFLACSPYKFFAPHIGVLYGKRKHLRRLMPYKVRPATSESPERWETGTQNHEGLAGVTAAIDYLEELGHRVSPEAARGKNESRRPALLSAMEAIRRYERNLVEPLIRGLLAVPGVTVYGITDPARFDRRTPTVALRSAKRTPQELASVLGDQGMFTWAGNYYALNLTERLGVESAGGMLRLGLVHYNTTEEVTRVVDALGEGAATG
ncbi:MAG TPA: cysteine desulfurase-like protein [Nitrospirales bacterium]|jgi:cysteine desulfurase family protein (TIGR01976 family)